MKQIGSADFRKGYASQTEPVEVTAYGHVIGTWYPSGAELPASTTDVEGTPLPEARDFAAPAPRMTIRPEKGPRKTMVGKEQRVIDPLDIRRREREAYSNLHRQMYGGGKAKVNQSSG
jgi:hypothetical protein